MKKHVKVPGGAPFAVAQQAVKQTINDVCLAPRILHNLKLTRNSHVCYVILLMSCVNFVFLLFSVSAMKY